MSPSDIARMAFRRLGRLSQKRQPPRKRLKPKKPASHSKQADDFIKSLPGGDKLSKTIKTRAGGKRSARRSSGTTPKGKPGRPKSKKRHLTRVGKVPVEEGLTDSASVKKAWKTRKKLYGPKGRKSSRSFATAGRNQPKRKPRK